MNLRPLLTVAIPTYNRSRTLRRALDSVLSQLPEAARVEILISDNASPDDTAEVVRHYTGRYPFIRYSRNPVNRGSDYNMHKLVQESTGDHVYMLSDDDLLLPGALPRMLALIRDQPEVGFFYLNGIGFTLNQQQEPAYFPKPVIWHPEDFISTDRNEFIGFLKLQITFVSAFLFRRKLWNVDGKGEQFFGTDLYMSFELVRLLARSERFMYVAGPLVGVHAEYTVGSYNIFHAFAWQWRRLLLEEAVGQGFDRRQMAKVFASSLGPLGDRLLAIKQGAVRHPLGLANLKVIVSSTYDTKQFWLHLLPLLLTPAFVVQWWVRAKRVLRGAVAVEAKRGA